MRLRLGPGDHPDTERWAKPTGSTAAAGSWPGLDTAAAGKTDIGSASPGHSVPAGIVEEDIGPAAVVPEGTDLPAAADIEDIDPVEAGIDPGVDIVAEGVAGSAVPDRAGADSDLAPKLAHLQDLRILRTRLLIL